jgi:diguanylate cyclase (GGDEF)-like protein/PAS domain S-box-containing protein
MLQHELLMSLGASVVPEETLKNFAERAIKALGLRCVYVLEKDNPILGLDSSIHTVPKTAADFSRHEHLKKFDNCGFPEESDYVEEIVKDNTYWYCFSLKNLGFMIFEREEKPFDSSVITALIAPVARFTQAYVDRKQFLLNENHRKHIKTISDRVQSEKYRLEHIFRTIRDGVLVLDNDGLVYFANLAAHKLFGLDENYQLEDHFTYYFRILEIGTKKDLTRTIVECCSENGEWLSNEPVILTTWEDKEVIVRLNVKGMKDTKGAENITEQYFVSTFQDISETYQMEQKLKWQATHDPLTQCLNRRGFEEQLKELVSLTGRQSNHALICMDLDRFKHVNDIGGHSAGDALLQQVTVLMQQEIRETDFLARVGGDEYCIILYETTRQESIDIAERIRKQIDRLRFKWEDNIFTIGISLGVSEITPEENDTDVIFLRADEACMSSKENGRNQVTFAHVVDVMDASEDSQSSEWLHMNYLNCVNKSLSDSDDEYQIVLFKQDIRSIADEELPDHQEVLIRIEYQDRLILPNAFLPAAERCGKVCDIDLWVLANTLEYLVHNRDVHLNVNISGVTLSDDASRSKIFELICEYPREAKQLCIEITETAAITNLTKCIAFVERISNLGVSFALDDFGTGVSSFHYLKNLPVKYLKIDGSFIEDICSNKIDEIVVQSIVAAASAMKIKTVAEYVSDQKILSRVKDLGIDYAQGYCLSKPVELTRTKNYKKIKEMRQSQFA